MKLITILKILEEHSIFKIIFRIFKITHLKQFLSIIISFSIIFWVIRIIKTINFFIIIIICSLLILVLFIIELISDEFNNENSKIEINNYSLINLKSHLKYELKKYYSIDYPGELGICQICLFPIKEGSDIISLPCLHCFHKECFEKWSRVRSLCPSCKSSFL